MTKKKVIKKTFICPNCKKEQDEVMEWQEANIGYRYDLTTMEYQRVDEVIGNDVEYLCPECEEQIKYSIIEKFF